MSFVKKAYDISRKQVFFCRPAQPITEIAEIMYKNKIGSILVKEGESLKGIITVNDLLRQIAKKSDPEKTLARDVMSSPVITASKDLEIDELVDVFKTQRVSRMVLLDNKNCVVGVVRDIAVYKYLTFFKYDKEAREVFGREYSELY